MISLPARNDARRDIAPIGGELDAVDFEVDGVEPDDGGGTRDRELDGDLSPKAVGGRVEREVERVADGGHVAGEPERRRGRRRGLLRRRARPSAGQGGRHGDDAQSANHRGRIANLLRELAVGEVNHLVHARQADDALHQLAPRGGRPRPPPHPGPAPAVRVSQQGPEVPGERRKVHAADAGEVELVLLRGEAASQHRHAEQPG